MLYLIIGDKQFSSWSMRASIILKEKEVPYTELLAGLDWPIKFLETGITPINKKGDYDLPKEPACGCGCQLTQLIKMDPTDLIRGSIVEHLPRVPILIDTNTDAVICDVLAISEYLEENFQNYPSLLGSDPRKRNDIRVFSGHIHADLLPLMSGISYSHSFRNPIGHEIDEETKNQIDETITLLEKTLKRKSFNNWEGDYLFGEFSLADAMFAPIAQQFKGWNIKIKDSEIKRYLDVLLKRFSVSSYLQEANTPYELLRDSIENSTTWISRHYRYWPEIGMIHNISTSVYHILDDVSREMFELAYEGKSEQDIIDILLEEYNVDFNTLKQDVTDFFIRIHPNNIVKNDFSEITL
ncbi:PqqD family peptide modification chaperone [Rummeliibacillus sp. SL167]|uniref:PqqD family peptide modification chaperone n=1 Tax=Rummeliibacillus sp. SL167 TaxID=2579792 RepID=UPI0011B7DCE6|nr:PqqD family peptide modification chaperone [Rummeliibacillus sp. SL167]